MTGMSTENIRTFGLYFLLSICSCVASNSWAAAGALKFTSHVHDFGDVYQGLKVVHKFQFVNSGSGPVAITGVHAACGCTAVEVEKGREYAPGESGFLEIFFDTDDFQGNVVKTITIMTSEKLLPDRVLTVKANVKNEMEVMPPLADFGTVLDLGTAVAEVKIRPIGNFQLKISGVEFKKDLLAVDSETIGKETVFKIRIAPSAPTGFFKETIVVKTNSKFRGNVEIPVRATIKGNVDFSPTYIEFGAIPPNETVKRSVTLKSTTPIDIIGTEVEFIVNGRRVADATTFLKIDTAGFEQNKQHIAVEISNKQAPSGAVHGKLIIKTSDARQSKINVDFYAFFR